MNAAALDGLGFLRAIAAGELPPAPIAELMGFTLDEVDEGRAVFRGIPSNSVYNPIGSVHGGWAMTLLDSAMGCAVHSTLPAGTGYGTLEAKVNLTRAIGVDTGPVLAIGEIVHRGSRVATAEGRLVAEESGKLLAHATTTCLITPR